MLPQLLAIALAGTPEVVTLDVGAHPSVELSAIQGDVRIRREGTGPVRLEAQLPEKGNHRDAWTFQVKADGDQVTAKVCCGKCNDDGNRDCSDGPIKITGTVPERTQLELACVSANVKVEGGSGDLNVATVSGPLEVTRTLGDVSLNAVSGDIRFAPAKASDSKLNTVSGDVQVVLPERASAEIRFSSMSGDGPRRAVAGDGDASIAVSTLSGNLRVKGARQTE